MEEIVLKADARTEKPNKVRREGFIPGVLNGPGTASVPVKFDGTAIGKVIAKHGEHAKLWIDFDNNKKYGFLKEIQRDPVEPKILHVSVQLVARDQLVKAHLPIVIQGHAELEHKLLQLQIQKAVIEVEGKAAVVPEEVTVDVSGMELGKTITAADFHLPEGVKVLDPENETYAVIKQVKEEVPEEEDKEEEPQQEAAE